MTRAHWLATIAMLSACVESSTTVCDDGRTCPVGTTCAGRFCASESQLVACAAHTELDACDFEGIGGYCQAGACIAARCGDGVVVEPEQCDGTAGITNCVALGFYDPAPVTCTAGCTFDVSACTRQCGDGSVDPEEQCDSDFGAAVATCASLGFYDGIDVTCSGSCTYDITACDRRCGDGTKDAEELCDGVSPPGTCVDYGYSAGRLSCSDSCGPGLTDCRRIGWHRQLPAGGKWWNAIWSAPTGELFIAGSGDVVQIKDGAITETVANIGSVQGIWGTSATNMFAVDAYYGEIAHFDGQTWTRVYQPTSSEGLNGIAGSAGDNIWAVGVLGNSPFTNQARILHFDGTAWSVEYTSVDVAELKAVWASATGEAWAVGKDSTGGMIMHRTNGSWALEQNTLPGGRLDSIWGTAPDNIYAVGGGGLFHRDATGWTRLLNTSAGLLGVWGRGANDVYAVGHADSTTGHGLVLHFDGTSWWQLDSGTSRSLYVVGGTADRVVAAGIDDIALVHARASWSPATGAFDRVVTAASDGTLVAASAAPSSGFVRRTLDAWTSIQSLTGTVTAIWAHTSTTVFAATGTQLHRFTSSWSPVASTGGPSIRALWGTSATDVWAALDNGSVGRWNGSTWSATVTGTSAVLTSIGGASVTDVFVVGREAQSSVIRRFAGTWSPMTHPNVAGGLEDVWVRAANDVWAVGAGGAILHFDGAAWTLIETGVTANLFAVAGSAADDVWAVGELGTILHYDGVGWSPVRSALGSAAIVDVTVRDRLVVFVSAAREMTALVREPTW